MTAERDGEVDPMVAPDDQRVQEQAHGTGAAEGHTFDKAYWEQHWRQAPGESIPAGQPPNPYLIDEVADLTPGSALDAGCGAGAEAIWLATAGWRVTAADISTEALARAAASAPADDDGQLDWIQADLGVWEPGHPFDLVTTHYAHPAMPQLDFYNRIARWVAPGGTLLIVGHSAWSTFGPRRTAAGRSVGDGGDGDGIVRRAPLAGRHGRRAQPYGGRPPAA